MERATELVSSQNVRQQCTKNNHMNSGELPPIQLKEIDATVDIYVCPVDV